MQTSVDIEKQIAAVQSRQRAAIEAEQARIAKENSAKSEIARTESELAALRQQEIQARLHEDAARSQALAEQNRAAIQAATVQLDNASAALVQALPLNVLANVQKTMEASFDLASSVAQYSAAAQFEQREAVLLQYRELPGRGEFFAQEAERAAIGRGLNQLAPVISPMDALAGWIAAAPDDSARRVRQAVGYVLTGQVINPQPGFQAQPRQWNPYAR